MRIKVLLGISVLVILIFAIQYPAFAQQAPSMPPQNTPPIVQANSMEANSSIYSSNGQLWASIDIEYEMNTIYNLGDSFSVVHLGQFNVVTDKLQAHYPMSLSAQNISVQINNQEINWQYDNKGFCHIFDSNIPEINWTIQPVPKTFTVTVHYEQPIPKTSLSNAYLGQNDLVFPLIPRFGSTDTPSYPLYCWFYPFYSSMDYGNSVAKFTISSQLAISPMNAYTIGLTGNLTKVNSLNENPSELTVSVSQNQPTFPNGLVVTMNAETVQNSFLTPITIVVISVTVVILLLSLVLLLYLRHHQVKKGSA